METNTTWDNFYTQAHSVDELNLRFPSEWKNKMHFFIYSD